MGPGRSCCENCTRSLAPRICRPAARLGSIRQLQNGSKAKAANFFASMSAAVFGTSAHQEPATISPFPREWLSRWLTRGRTTSIRRRRCLPMPESSTARATDYALVHLVSQEMTKDLIGSQVIDHMQWQCTANGEGRPAITAVVFLE